MSRHDPESLQTSARGAREILMPLKPVNQKGILKSKLDVTQLVETKASKVGSTAGHTANDSKNLMTAQEHRTPTEQQRIRDHRIGEDSVTQSTCL